MTHEPILQPQCIVNGVQNFVFRLSQITGMAPLQFDNTPDGWRIHVSRKLDIYGKIVVTIFVLISLGTLMVDLSLTDRSFKSRSEGAFVLWISDVLIISSVNMAAIYNGVERMRNTIDCIAQLKQINKDLKLYHPLSFPSEKKQYIIVILSMIYGITTILIDYGVSLYAVITKDDSDITPIFYVFYYTLIINVHLIVLLLVLSAMSILPALSAVNGCLMNILKEKYSCESESSIAPLNSGPIFTMKHFRTKNRRKSTNRVSCLKHDIKGTKSIPSILNRLAFIHTALCDIVGQLNHANGLVVVLLFASFHVHVIFTCYHYLVELVYHGDYEHYNTALQCAWIIYHFSKILAVIEPCHRTQVEMDCTRTLINQMIRYTPAEDFAVNAELKMFKRHLVLNPTTYSPMQIFTLNRGFLLNFLGSITTYLVIIAQL